jgi:hypothetical protein
VKVHDPFLTGPRSREEVRRRMTDIVAQSAAERIVVIDAPTSRYDFPMLGWTYDKMAGVVDAMEQQSRFKRYVEHEIPSQGGRATVWMRQ